MNNLAKGVLIVAIAVAVGAAWWLGARTSSRDQGTEAIDAVVAPLPGEAPPPLPYEFVTLPGAQRGEPDREMIEIPSISKKLPIYRIGAMVSEQGETKTQFLHRVREEMVAYSERQGYEACAEICTDGTRYSVIMTTISAVAYCAVQAKCVDGHQPMHQSIHSHCPRLGSVRATIADEYLSGGDLRRGKNYPRCNTEKFSSTDFAGRRPGWLAGREALYRHDGPKRIEVIHPEASPSATDAASASTSQ